MPNGEYKTSFDFEQWKKDRENEKPSSIKIEIPEGYVIDKENCDLENGVFGCEIIVLDDKEDVSNAEELTRYLMALLASFSGKYYGRRSLERCKQNKNAK